MKILELEVKKFNINIENIIDSQGREKLVIIISNLNIKSDNGKNIGKIIGLINPKKKYLLLNQMVEFNEKNIKWACARFVNNDGLYVIKDFWIKPFCRDVKIDVPIKVFENNKEIIIMRKLTYKQFQENRLLEFYGHYNYRLIAAYKNFNELFKNNQYWYCINSTVRNYRVDQKHLIGFLGMVDSEKKKIKNEWVRYIQYDYQQNQNNLELQNLINRYESKDSSKVIQIQK